MAFIPGRSWSLHWSWGPLYEYDGLPLRCVTCCQSKQDTHSIRPKRYQISFTCRYQSYFSTRFFGRARGLQPIGGISNHMNMQIRLKVQLKHASTSRLYIYDSGIPWTWGFLYLLKLDFYILEHGSELSLRNEQGMYFFQMWTCKDPVEGMLFRSAFEATLWNSHNKSSSMDSAHHINCEGSVFICMPCLCIHVAWYC